ncbi:MAG: hypothetical protein DME07_01715 [Candidatus Rokuibacteriota bacterium]|nr:MAG: hypothetical protein DME07_01715 [Candidatus Rokubacteria bacterium]PYN58418.1 MAG: hypothetical protein DMD94_00905 [Candidatus Rokubacteria bacterium]
MSPLSIFDAGAAAGAGAVGAPAAGGVPPAGAGAAGAGAVGAGGAGCCACATNVVALSTSNTASARVSRFTVSPPVRVRFRRARRCGSGQPTRPDG